MRRWLAFPPAFSSPELNHDEYLNQDVKGHIRQLHPRPVDKPGLKDALRRFLRGRQRQPQIVRNYFKAPQIEYAA